TITWKQPLATALFSSAYSLSGKFMSENDPPKPAVAATPAGRESYGVESWTALQWSSSSLPQQGTRLSGSDALLLLETIRQCIAANTEEALREKVYSNIQK